MVPGDFWWQISVAWCFGSKSLPLKRIYQIRLDRNKIKKKKKKIKIALKKTKKERRRGRSLPWSRAYSRVQKSSEAGRRGGEGVRREEQRDEMGQCERTNEFMSLCEIY